MMSNINHLNRYALFELRKIRTNYLITYSIPSHSDNNTRIVIFSSTAGSQSCKKKNRRRMQACHILGVKFGNFIYDYCNRIKNYSDDEVTVTVLNELISYLENAVISIKCSYKSYLKFKNAARYTYNKRMTALERMSKHEHRCARRGSFSWTWLKDNKNYLLKKLNFRKLHPKYRSRNIGRRTNLHLRAKLTKRERSLSVIRSKLRSKARSNYMLAKRAHRISKKKKSKLAITRPDQHLPCNYWKVYAASMNRPLTRGTSWIYQLKSLDNVFEKTDKKIRKRRIIPRIFQYKVKNWWYTNKNHKNYKTWTISKMIYPIVYYFYLFKVGFRKQQLFSDSNLLNNKVFSDVFKFGSILNIIDKTFNTVDIKRGFHKMILNNKLLTKLQSTLCTQYNCYDFDTVYFFFHIYNSSLIHKLALLPLSPFELRHLRSSLFCSTGSRRHIKSINLTLSNAVWYNSDLFFLLSPSGFFFWLQRYTHAFFSKLLKSVCATSEGVNALFNLLYMNALFFARSKRWPWSPYRYCDEFMKAAFDCKDLLFSERIFFKKLAQVTFICNTLNKKIQKLKKKIKKKAVIKKRHLYNLYRNSLNKKQQAKKHLKQIKGVLKNIHSLLYIANKTKTTDLKAFKHKNYADLFSIKRSEIEHICNTYKRRVNYKQERHYANHEKKCNRWIDRRHSFARRNDRFFRNWVDISKFLKRDSSELLEHVIEHFKYFETIKYYCSSFFSSAFLDYLKENFPIFYVLNKYKLFVKHFFFFSDRVSFSITNKNNATGHCFFTQTLLFTKSLYNKDNVFCSFETGIFSYVTYNVYLLTFNKKKHIFFLFFLYVYIFFSFLPLLVKFLHFKNICVSFFFFAKNILLLIFNKKKETALLSSAVLSFLCDSIFYFRSLFSVSKLKKSYCFGLRHLFYLSLRSPKKKKRSPFLFLKTHTYVSSYSLSLFRVISNSFLLKVKYTFFLFFLSELKFNKTNTLHNLIGYYYFTSELFCLGFHNRLIQFFFFTIERMFTFVLSTFRLIDKYIFFFADQTILFDTIFKQYRYVPTYLYTDLSFWDLDLFFSLIYKKVRQRKTTFIRNVNETWKKLAEILLSNIRFAFSRNIPVRYNPLRSMIKKGTFMIIRRPHKPFNGCRKRKKKNNRRYNS